MAILVQSNKKPSVSFPSQTGSIVTFNSQYAGLPLKSHKIALTATQSGSGTPSPVNIRNINGWSSLNIGHYGLNVWGNGITLSDASIGGTYKGFKKKYNSNIRMVLFDRDTTQDIRGVFLGFTGSGKDATEGHTWVISNGNIFSEGNIFSDTYEYISIYPGTQETLDKIFNRFYVLTVIDSGDYSAYVPYVGGNTTITIGSTVYGGEYDARTGLLTITHGFIASYNGETINEPWISSMDKYVEGTTPTNGAQVVYPLSTPQTIQLPPCPIDTLQGVNNIWADTGETTVQHIKIGG